MRTYSNKYKPWHARITEATQMPVECTMITEQESQCRERDMYS